MRQTSLRPCFLWWIITIVLVLRGAGALRAVEFLQGPRVHTVEIPVSIEALPRMSERIDFELEKPLSLDGVSLILVDAIVLTHVPDLSGAGGSASSAEVHLLNEGRRARRIATVSDSLTANAPDAEWPAVFRPSYPVASRLVVDGIRVVARSTSHNFTRLEGIHAGALLRVHFVVGALDSGSHSLVPIEGMPPLSATRGESAWQQVSFSEPVDMRDVALVSHSGFSISSNTNFGAVQAVVEVFLDDGTALPLDDSYAPSRGDLRPRVLSRHNSLRIGEAERERLQDEGISAIGLRAKVQVTGGSIELTAPTMFFFFRDFEDCNQNAVADDEETGGVLDCNANGILDACELDCDANGVPDDCDIAAGVRDCNGNGVPDVCDVVPVLPLPVALDPISLEFVPEDFAVGDVDSDGDQDIVLLAADALVVAENRGGGQLAVRAPISVDTDTSLTRVRLGDLDGDGALDLAAGGRREVILFRGDGTGGFLPTGTVELSRSLSRALIDDADGDSDLDLVVLTSSASQVDVFLNDGTGAIAAESTPAATADEERLRDISVCDLDGDGVRELVAVADSGDLRAFEISDGGWTEAAFAALGEDSLPRRMLAIDLDGDPSADFAFVIGSPADRIVFAAGSPTGLVEIGTHDAGGTVTHLAAGQVDDDGRVDTVAAVRSTSSLEVVLADGKSFPLLAGIDPIVVATVDLDAVGNSELIALDRVGQRLLSFRIEDPVATSGDCNGSGVPDECELADGTLVDEDGDGGPDDCVGASFRRGDCNDDGSVDISDAVRDFRFCFSGESIPCAAACDTDGDGSPCTGVTDGVRLLQYLFRGGEAPPAPFPECGPAEGKVDCETAPANCQ